MSIEQLNCDLEIGKLKDQLAEARRDLRAIRHCYPNSHAVAIARVNRLQHSTQQLLEMSDEQFAIAMRDVPPDPAMRHD